MEDDEDCFVTIGTAFEIPEEDEAPKRRFDKHEQVAVDSKGRRRFHGAFTGGFSAGYFNTVGTKEGWTPSTFRSSRSNRVPKETDTQRPEDYMDDEDFGEHGIAPRKFMTKQTFTPTDKELAERKRAIGQAVDEGVLRSAVPGGLPVDDLIVPSKVSVGISLLRKMGWKEGQGVGDKQAISESKSTNSSAKKVYGCSLPSTSQDENDIDISSLQHFLSPKDVQPIDFTPKDNRHGIGYSGIDPKSAMFLGAGNLSGVFKPTGSEKRGIRGQAFGVGAFEEEDENIYGMDDMSDYDFAMSSEKESKKIHNLGWTGPPKKDKSQDAISGFHKASIPTAINKIFRPPLLPHNFIPKHEFCTSVKPKVTIPSQRNVLTSNDRAVLLGEKMPKKAFESVFDIISDKDKKKIEDAKSGIQAIGKNVASNTNNARLQPPAKPSRWDNRAKVSTPVAHSTISQEESEFRPFANDPEKQQRYNSFLSSKKLGKELDLKYDGSMTEWEKEREIEEFSRASILFRPMSTSISSRFTRGSILGDSTKKKKDNEVDEKSDSEKAAKLGLFGTLTRQSHDWYPSSLLCKRFNVPDPYPESQFTGTVGRGRKAASDWLLDLGTAAKIEQSEMDDKTSEKIDSDSQLIQEETKGQLENEEGRREVGKQGESTVLRKHTDQKAFAKAGPLSYLNDIDKESNDGSSEVNKMDSEKEEDSANKPAMDLFKAIFADSSDSSDDDLDKGEKDDVKNDLREETVVTDTRSPERDNSQPSSVALDSRNDIETDDGNRDIQIVDLNKPSRERKSSAMQNEYGPPLPVSKHKARAVEAAVQYEEKLLFPSSQSSSVRRTRDRNTEFDKQPKSPEDDEKSKGYQGKEGHREKKKKKKKDKKRKKFKKKQKKEHKAKRSRFDEENSSSEWSSYSDDDVVVLEKGWTGVRKDSVIKESKQRSESMEHARRRKDRDLEREFQTEFKNTCNESTYVKSCRKKDTVEDNEQFGEVKDCLKPKRDDGFIDSRKKSERKAHRAKTKDTEKGSTRLKDIQTSDSNIALVKTSKHAHSSSNSKALETAEEGVPSAKELYKKLKKHGLTLKRMSAADFM